MNLEKTRVVCGEHAEKDDCVMLKKLLKQVLKQKNVKELIDGLFGLE